LLASSPLTHAFLHPYHRIIQGKETGLAQVLMKHYRFWYHDKMHETSQVRFVGGELEIPATSEGVGNRLPCVFGKLLPL
jgi:hypothetical protein